MEPVKTVFSCERYIRVDWPAPENVRAFTTTRHGGVSSGGYGSLNLGLKSGDSVDRVSENRQLLTTDWQWERDPAWLNQVHGTTVVNGVEVTSEPEADACFAEQAGYPCVVMTADCLPVLFCDQSGSTVAAAHAGWKGLAAGVLENTVQSMGCDPEQLLVWLGPAISQSCFEVGPEVREQFITVQPKADTCFIPGMGDRWQADLYQLARLRLKECGVKQVYGGQYCTYRQDDLFYSYRRDGKKSGRMASVVWIE